MTSQGASSYIASEKSLVDYLAGIQNTPALNDVIRDDRQLSFSPQGEPGNKRLSPPVLYTLCWILLFLGIMEEGCMVVDSSASNKLPWRSAQTAAEDVYLLDSSRQDVERQDVEDARSNRRTDLSAGCGKIPSYGCCEGQILWWCESNVLKHVDCSSRPRCGWRETHLSADFGLAGFYDCDTSGVPDPIGMAMECSNLPGEAGVPLLDAKVSDSSQEACRSISDLGCCDGETLKYCDQGQLVTISCDLNKYCGWKANPGEYDCGTLGQADPGEGSQRVAVPKMCPGSKPKEDVKDANGLDLIQDSLPPAGDSSGEKNPDGCSCSVKGEPRPWPAVVTTLLELAWVWFRRKRKET